MRRVRRSLLLAATVVACLPARWAAGDNPEPPRPTVVVVVGASGEEQYGRQFAEWADRWQEAADKGGAQVVIIGREARSEAKGEQASEGEMTDRERLAVQLKEHLAAASSTELWLVLLGHGTFDGRTARFNLRGPDVSAEELHEWLAEARRPVVVVNCSSSSAPFLPALAGPDRIIITATRSGAEQNFARFGDYLSQSIAHPEADLDKDGQTSLLEAFLVAARKTFDFYDRETRLATEHALLDDNGDRQGTPGDWFRGVRAIKKPEGGLAVDGRRAHQVHLVPSDSERALSPDVRRRRDELELAIFALRDQKPTMPEEDYYRRLEELALEMAKLYETAAADHEQADEREAPH